MRSFLLTLSACLLLASSSNVLAAKNVDTSVSDECRTIQREAQTRLAEIGTLKRSQRREGTRAVVRELRDLAGGRLPARRCAGCILRQLANDTPLAEQTPCGQHDECVAGPPLPETTNDCVEAICRTHKQCCKRSWDDTCVAAVTEICGRSCDDCAHSECEPGAALGRQCGECVTLVCETDPYCCDTTWDESCVLRATTACEPACAEPTTTTSTSTTSTSSTTSTVPTTTVPECVVEADCTDADACTEDQCDVGTCSYTSVVCDDGNQCTVDEHCVAGICIGKPRDCNDQNRCTLDYCSPGSGCKHQLATCSDGDACTIDSCDPASGCVNQAVDCDDGDPCTVDTCDWIRGCEHTTDATAPGCDASSSSSP